MIKYTEEELELIRQQAVKAHEVARAEVRARGVKPTWNIHKTEIEQLEDRVKILEDKIKYGTTTITTPKPSRRPAP